MKHIALLILSVLFIERITAQTCEKTFESNYLQLTICYDSTWIIEQTLPYIKIKTPEVKTFITILSAPTEANETAEELVERSFQLDRKTYPSIEKLVQEELFLDGVKGILYSTKTPEKEAQTTTFICVNHGKKFTINNNCYSGCSKAISTLKKVITHIRFQNIEAPKLKDTEIKNFEIFKAKLHAAFKESSAKSFDQLIVTQTLMLELINLHMKDETMKKRYTEIIRNNWKEFSKEFVAKSKASFSQLISTGREMGINWKDIEFLGMEYDLTSAIPGITSATCKYKFSYNEKNYILMIDNVELLESGWYISKLNATSITKM
jgi:hypothetical protein